VTNRTAATRYARTLLDVGQKERADLDKIESDLSRFAALLESHESLRKVLYSPVVPAARKHAAVEALLQQLAPTPIVAKLLLLLAGRDRMPLLPDLLATYRQRLLDVQHVVRAEVTTALPISAETTQRIEQGLATATGRTVQLSTRIDPQIVGGMVARVGGIVYDASVTGHLQRMKQRLEESI
jgi:F-type H+-transporting ATPase subunit delta